MFVVFEGIDGSGKTTISNRVAERLRDAGVSVTHLRADGKFASRVSEAIRDLCRDVRNWELEPEAEFLMYVARDVQLIGQALRPALGRDEVVFADRFLYTAEVIGRHGRHLDRAFTEPVLRAAAGGLEPDLVVLIDVDPSLARARRKASKIEVFDPRPPSRKGLSGVGLQHRIRGGYLDLAKERPDRWVVVDNQGLLEEILVRVTQLVLDARTQGTASALTKFRAARDLSAPARAPRPLGTVDEALEAFLRFVDARIEREPRVASYLMGGLFGPGIDERRRVLASRVPKSVLAALSGLDDPASWELRQRLAAKYPAQVAATLAGFPAEHRQAAELREKLLPETPAAVLATLSRSDHPRAWELRDRLYSQFREIVVQGLGFIPSERAWAFRERFLVDTRIERPARYDFCKAAARSVAGLDGTRAWEVREEVRRASPIAALSGLNGLVCPRSFAWREELLPRAPKGVMRTLFGVDCAEAWTLRRRVADDCKEAIDSIYALGGLEAWQLREEFRNRWTSTVVKTLGPLADQERGKSFVERQLSEYPGNISLLKHAAAIALGTHRLAPFFGD